MAPHSENQQHPSGLLPKPLGVAKNQNNANNKPGGSSPTFQRGRDLQSAMQHAPTIRVIHIFAPKVIKTDVANFRSTVQKLTGRGKTRSQRRAARGSSSSAGQDCAPVDEFVVTDPADVVLQLPHGGGAANADGSLYWDQSEKEVRTLQRMVGDACGVTTTTTTDHLVRCDSDDSATYSLDDSGNTFSGDTSSPGVTTTSPLAAAGTMVDAGSFSFYPQREMPYSLSEIPAPFFGGAAAADMLYPTGGSCSSCLPPMASYGAPGSSNNVFMGLPTSHLMDHSCSSLSSLGFEPDVGLPLLPNLPDAAAAAAANSSAAGGSLFDLMPRQHCRLSVQSPYRGASFFEPI